MALEKQEFQSLENMYEDLTSNLKKGRDMKLSVAERTEAKEMMAKTQAEIDEFLPAGMTEQEKKSLRDDFQRLMILERDPNARIDLEGLPEKIDKNFPGFAAYKKEQFAKVLEARKASAPAPKPAENNTCGIDLSAEIKTAQAKPTESKPAQTRPAEGKSAQDAPVQTKPAEALKVAVNSQDVAEFGKEEAEYLAKMKTDMVYIGKAAEGESFDVEYYLERYRQALRNNGPVDGVEYNTLDAYLMHTSPETVSKTMRRDGDVRQKPSVDDVIQFFRDSIDQADARKVCEGGSCGIAALDMLLARQSKATPKDIEILYNKLYANSKSSRNKLPYDNREIHNAAFAVCPEKETERDNVLHRFLGYLEAVQGDPCSIPYNHLCIKISSYYDKGLVPEELYRMFEDRGCDAYVYKPEAYKKKLELLGGGIGTFGGKKPFDPAKAQAYIEQAEDLRKPLAKLSIKIDYLCLYRTKKKTPDFFLLGEIHLNSYLVSVPEYVYSNRTEQVIKFANKAIYEIKDYLETRIDSLRSQIIKGNLMENPLRFETIIGAVGHEAHLERMDYSDALNELKKKQDEWVDAARKRVKSAALTPYGDYYADKKIRESLLTYDQMREQARAIAAQKAANRKKYGE